MNSPIPPKTTDNPTTQNHTADGNTRHCLVILNRRASEKRMDRFHAVLAALNAAGWSHHVQEIGAAGDAALFAASANAQQVQRILVAGGDGTINDAINGFHDKTPPLGLIPLGTANVLAHEIGLSLSPQEIAETIINGTPAPILPGHVNGRRFMMMASVGFDAHVVGGVTRRLKRHIGKLVYAVEALRQLFRYPCPHLDVEIDGKPVQAATLVISRGRMYGGRFIMAPKANLQTPCLYVSLFRRQGRLAMAGYSAALPLGLLNRWKLIEHVEAKEVLIKCRAGDPVQADGDVTATLPAVIGLAQHPIHLMVPTKK